MTRKLFLSLLVVSLYTFTQDQAGNALRKAIVIGASSGMGREVAKRLGQEGYSVGLVARRVPLLESLQKEIAQPTYVKQIDAASPDAREKLAALIQEMKGVDLVMISISAYLDNRNTTNPYGVNERTWEEKERTVNVEAKGFIALADVALEHFKKQGHGHLVGVSSTSGLRGNANVPEYSACKACISTYMEGKRNELYSQKRDNIYITDIVPGFVAVEHSPLGEDPSAYWEITTEQAGTEIMAGIKAKKKVVYVPARVWLLAVLHKYLLPDCIYNRWLSWM